MLPMGTIMAASMLVGVVFTVNLKGYNPLSKLPKFFVKLIASFVLICGLWNVFWYGAQHLGEFWGSAALVSGLLLILTSLYLVAWEKLPKFLLRIKPLVLFLLLICFFLYSVTIYNL